MSSKKNIAIGIDVSKDHCDICLIDEKENITHKGQYPEQNYKALAKKNRQGKTLDCHSRSHRRL